MHEVSFDFNQDREKEISHMVIEGIRRNTFMNKPNDKIIGETKNR